MMLPKSAPPRATGSRSGFTLIEMLVVIGIISVLLALTAGAAIQVFAEQQKRVSQDRVTNVSSMLDQQWKAAVDDARSINSSAIPPGVQNMATDSNGPNAERARIIWIKINLIREFPQSYAEALVPSGPVNPYVTPGNLPPVDAYVQAINNSNQAAHTANTEAAACLYMALRRARRGQGQYVDPESLGKNAIRDSDNDGIMEIVDGWGVPLSFYRFPTRNSEFLTYPGLKLDPQDPGGVLLDPAWNNQAAYNAQQGVYWFEQICHLVHDPTAGSWAPKSYYLVPVVASAGRNGLLGLNADMSSDGTNADSDNIYGYRKFQARGD
jgi:prepilin-type N-terminal cleavage/methylation domain-containing protein